MPRAAALWGREAPQPPTPKLGRSCNPTCSCCHCSCPGAACSPSIPPYPDFSQQELGPQAGAPITAPSTSAHPHCDLHKPFVPLTTSLPLLPWHYKHTHACAPSPPPTPCAHMDLQVLSSPPVIFVYKRHHHTHIPNNSGIELCTPGQQKCQGLAMDLRLRFAGKSGTPRAERLHPSE